MKQGLTEEEAERNRLSRDGQRDLLGRRGGPFWEEPG